MMQAPPLWSVPQCRCTLLSTWRKFCSRNWPLSKLRIVMTLM